MAISFFLDVAGTFRFYHDHAGGNENTIWWSTDDAFYNYFDGEQIKIYIVLLSASYEQHRPK
jgi:hypothetical protein